MPTVEEYERKLAHHDWYFDYSDDGDAWRRGRDSLSSLRFAQPKFDPDFEIWNKYAPAGMQIKPRVSA